VNSIPTADRFDYVTFAETIYLKTDMCKSESPQSYESRAQSADSSKACSNHTTFKCLIIPIAKTFNDIFWLIPIRCKFSQQCENEGSSKHDQKQSFHTFPRKAMSLSMAYERGYERYTVPGPNRFRGPGRMKVRTLRFFVTKAKLMVVFSICSAGGFNQLPH